MQLKSVEWCLAWSTALGWGSWVMLVLSIWFGWLYFTLRLVWACLEFGSALAQGRGAEDK